MASSKTKMEFGGELIEVEPEEAEVWQRAIDRDVEFTKRAKPQDITLFASDTDYSHYVREDLANLMRSIREDNQTAIMLASALGSYKAMQIARAVRVARWPSLEMEGRDEIYSAPVAAESDVLSASSFFPEISPSVSATPTLAS